MGSLLRNFDKVVWYEVGAKRVFRWFSDEFRKNSLSYQKSANFLNLNLRFYKGISILKRMKNFMLFET